MEKRPKGVTAVSLLVLIIAFVALIAGISVLVVGTPLDILWTLKSSLSPSIRGTMLGIMFGVFVMAIGLILLLSSYGLLKGNKIAWWAVVVIFGANALGDLVSLIMGNIQSISGVIIVGILLVYLTRPNVRSYFDVMVK
ncbi:MAG: hypothetical protein F8N15_08655 [Methanobacterium sp.]|nr:hypothetical protein [Methanobacterium sp.]